MKKTSIYLYGEESSKYPRFRPAKGTLTGCYGDMVRLQFRPPKQLFPYTFLVL